MIIRLLVFSLMFGVFVRFSVPKVPHNFQRKLFSTVLPYESIIHHSIRIHVNDFLVQKMNENMFSEYLGNTILEVKTMKKNAIFIHVPMEYSKYISSTKKYGFTFHHAENNTAVLQLWLAPCESKIPLYATHSCGVGGVVFSGDKVLIIKEQPPNDKIWKYPGGYTNLGENFGDAAIREVYEETNIRSKYIRLLAIRHSHAQQFGRSNLYVLCLLEALNTDIKADSEILDAKWETIDKFRSEYTITPLVQCVTDLAQNYLRNSNDGHVFQEKEMCYSLAGSRPFTLYY